MRSRAARIATVTLAWIALGTAGFFVFTSHQHILASAAEIRTVDLHAREADDALVDLRMAQQAYVASGQGVAFWMPKVASTRDSVVAALTAVRQSTTATAAQAAADEATAAIGGFAEVDKRARDYIRSGQLLMASDVIFTEGGQLITVATRQVETARLLEHQDFDAREAGIRRQQATAAAVAAVLAGLVALVLGMSGSEPTEAAQAPGASALNNLGKVTTAEGDEGIVSHARPGQESARSATAAPLVPAVPARNAVVLKAAADLATDLGRIRDSDELERLLGRTADLMDAEGLVVWIGNGETAAGADALRPVLAHGYAPHIVARMPSVPRSADNAAAAAYRTGALQIVLSRPGGAAGAIVAPIINANGCIGALSAEIKGGGEGSEAVQAVAAIVAAQLAGVLALASPERESAVPEARAVAQ